MFSLEPEGDGKCSVCHGTGYGGFVEMFLDPLSARLPECDECRGTGKCQTCFGAGMVEEFDFTAA